MNSVIIHIFELKKLQVAFEDAVSDQPIGALIVLTTKRGYALLLPVILSCIRHQLWETFKFEQC